MGLSNPSMETNLSKPSVIRRFLIWTLIQTPIFYGALLFTAVLVDQDDFSLPSRNDLLNNYIYEPSFALGYVIVFVVEIGITLILLLPMTRHTSNKQKGISGCLGIAGIILLTSIPILFVLRGLFFDIIVMHNLLNTRDTKLELLADSYLINYIIAIAICFSVSFALGYQHRKQKAVIRSIQISTALLALCVAASIASLATTDRMDVRIAMWENIAILLAVPIFGINIGLLSVLPVSYRKWNQLLIGKCESCGYDLTGIKDKCPECGTAISSQTA